MTKHRTTSQRTLSGLALAASIAISACGTVGATPSSAENSGSAASNYSTRLRAVNEALYPETAATRIVKPSRLGRLNEALSPDESVPTQTCRPRPC